MAITGTCRLCGEVRDLADSHIIPRSFWKGVTFEQNAQLLSNIAGEFPKRSRTGVYDQFACHECEASFGPFDTYAKEVLLDRFNSAPSVMRNGERVGLDLGQYDYGKLKLFFMITLWRAHSSTQAFYRKIDIGPLADPLRGHIRAGDAGVPDDFAVVLAAFDPGRDPLKLREAPLDPHPERYEGIRVYRFYMGGYVAHIKADNRAFGSLFREIQLTPGQNLRVPMRDPTQELRVMADIVAATERLRHGGS